MQIRNIFKALLIFLAALIFVHSNEPAKSPTKQISTRKFMPDDWAQSESASQVSSPHEELPRESLPQESTPHKLVARESVPSESLPNETLPNESRSHDSLPHESLPYESFLKKTKITKAVKLSDQKAKRGLEAIPSKLKNRVEKNKSSHSVEVHDSKLLAPGKPGDSVLGARKEDTAAKKKSAHDSILPKPVTKVTATHKSEKHNSGGHEALVDEAVGNKASGHEVTAHEASGHEAGGQEASGYEPIGHGASGQEALGHKASGHEATAPAANGHESSGHEASGHEASGHEASGHEASGHEASGHEASGHEASGHEASGHKASGHKANNHKASGHEDNGHKSTGHDANEHESPNEKHSKGLVGKFLGHEVEKRELKASNPDSRFFKAVDWDDGQAEILTYSIKRLAPGGEQGIEARIATEKLFYRLNGQVTRVRSAASDTEILSLSMMQNWKQGGDPRSSETVLQMPRQAPFNLLRQDQSFQSWPFISFRTLDCRLVPPKLRMHASGIDTNLELDLKQWPIFTEEMLFLYLRALPQTAGYSEEVWLLDGGGEGRFSSKSRIAKIMVRAKTTSVRDMETWYMTVDREGGVRSEFWLSAKGLHPVVMAILADQSVWTLGGISRRKFTTW